MGQRGFLERLLDGAEVEWFPLGDIGELVRGNGLPKADLTEQGVPAIHYAQLYTHYGVFTESTISFVSPETATKLKKVNTGDVIITNSSENIEDVGKSLVYLGEQQAVTGGDATIFKPDKKKIIGKYFAYFTRTITFEKLKRKYAKGITVVHFYATDLAKLKIPIPSLEIQAEIVRILDQFTELTEELTKELAKELTLRQKQYAYYREKLFTFNEGEAEWKTLGEVCEFKRGKSITKKDTIEGDIPVIAGGKKPAYFHNQSNRTGETIVISGSGAYAGFVTWWEKPIFVSDAFTVEPKDTLLPKYCFYFLKNQQEQLHKLKSIGGIPHVYSKDVSPLQIPIPPLEEQARIVAILDNFETLVNSLSEGLPREIELRKKQYEYYREKLFNFPQPQE